MFSRLCFLWITAAILTMEMGVTVKAAEAPADEGRALGKFLTQHGYGVLQVENDEGNHQFLEAQIDGKWARMIVDTGCGMTCLERAYARDLRLDIHDVKAQDQSVGGMIQGSSGFAPVKSFTLNGYEINRTNPVKILSNEASMPGEDGLFGYDFMRANAMFLPVGAKIVLFKPGATPVPSIDVFMKAMGYTAVPIRHGPSGIMIEGHLNGQPLIAVVDSGASYSVFSLEFVQKNARARTFPAPMDVRGVDGQRNTAYRFTPNTLDFGGMTLRPQELLAQPSPVMGPKTFEALLGYDVLAEHRAIIDLGHNALWLK